MRFFFLLMTMLLLTSCATHNSTGLAILGVPLQQEHEMASTQQPVPFIKHEEKGPFKSYLTMNLAYPEFAKIRESFEAKNHLHLDNRGEAHITVVTPPEYDKVLSKKISIKEIDDLAEKMKIQDSTYKKVCVGKGSAKIEGKEQSTYFVVVHSDRLFEIRKAIQDLYVSKGGKAQDFNADAFFPHVTLGYTKRDLHAEDGVIKDASACVLTLQESEPTKKK